MANVLLTAGMKFELNGKAGEIRFVDNDSVTIRFDKGESKSLAASEVFRYLQAGVLRILPAAATLLPHNPILTEAQIKEIEFYELFLRPLDERNARTPSRNTRACAEVIDEVAKEFALPEASLPSPITLYRMYRKWIEANRNTTVLLKSAVIYPRAPRISDEIRRLIDDVLDEHYLVRHGHKLAACFQLLCNKLKRMHRADETPSKSFFYEYANGLDPVEVKRFREGVTAARKYARTVKDAFMPAFLLERVELDAVHLKVGLVDDYGNYLGSVVLYLIIDCYSRCIIGFAFSVSERPAERAADAIECIKRAIVPKTPDDYPYTENQWHQGGKPVELAHDASPAFASTTVASFLARLSIHRHIPPTKEPWRRPFGERLNRTLRDQFAQTLPGYVGSRLEGRELDESMRRLACLTPKQFERLLVEWIVDGYHQTSHRGLNNKTPAEVWDEAAKREAAKGPTPDELDFINVFGGNEVKDKRLHKNTGIELSTIRYNSNALQALYHRLSRTQDKPKVTVFQDPYDISSITVLDKESGELLIVPNREHIAAGTSLQAYQSERRATSGEKRAHNPINRNHPVIQAAEAVQAERGKKRHVRHHPKPEEMRPQTQADLDAQMGASTPEGGAPTSKGAAKPGADSPSVPPSKNFRIE